MSPLNVLPLGQKNPLEEARGPHVFVKDGAGQNQGHYEARETTAVEFPKILYRAGKNGECRVVAFTVRSLAEEKKLLELGKRKGYRWVSIPSELPEIQDDVFEGAKLEDLMREPFGPTPAVKSAARTRRSAVNELDDMVQRPVEI